jgi:hypothetical protein
MRRPDLWIQENLGEARLVPDTSIKGLQFRKMPRSLNRQRVR